MGPPGRSATTIASPPELRSFPAAAPPSLRKSLDLNPSVLPVPITVRRPTLRSAGRTMSRVAQFLPVKCSAAAARATESTALPRILRVAAPSLRESSQNTIRTPLEGALNAANPSFKSFAIGNVPLRGWFRRPPELAPSGASPVVVTLGEGQRKSTWLAPDDRSFRCHQLRDSAPLNALNHSGLNFNGFALGRPFCGSIKLTYLGWRISHSGATLKTGRAETRCAMEATEGGHSPISRGGRAANGDGAALPVCNFATPDQLIEGDGLPDPVSCGARQCFPSIVA